MQRMAKGESRSELSKDFFNRLKALVEQDLTAQGLTMRQWTDSAPGIRSLQLRRVDGYSAEATTVWYDGTSE